MWSSETGRRAVLLGALALGGCGFTPAYGPGGDAARLRGRVRVEAPASFAGYLLRARLLDRLGPATEPRYLLSLDISEEVEQAAISADGAVLRRRERRESARKRAARRADHVAATISISIKLAQDRRCGTLEHFVSQWRQHTRCSPAKRGN